MKLGDRIVEYYEDRFKNKLMRRTVTIIRLDGKGFSKYTSALEKPFDKAFSDDMDATTIFLCKNIQGAKFGYTQSDEITIVLSDFDELESQAWFDYSVQKITSIAASIATAKFNELRKFRDPSANLAFFDARVFQVPTLDEMVNTIIWRQQDCTRNSISMAASAYFPHKFLEKKSSDEKQELLFTEKNINWNDYLPKFKRGSVIRKYPVTLQGRDGKDVIRNKWLADSNTPIISQDKNYLLSLFENKE